MALLAIQDLSARLTARGGALQILKGDEVIATKPIHEVDEVHIYGAIEISASARVALLQAHIDVLFFTPKGQWRGRLLSVESSNAARRMAQYRAIDQRPLDFARAIVKGKLYNQRVFLLRLRREHDLSGLGPTLAGLRKLMEQLDEATDLNTLRGLEGYGALLYFRGLSEAVTNPQFAFNGRNRRPPKDPINACLSFGYTLLLTRVESATRRAGLDPYLGALHEPGRGKPALVLDLMEALRPYVDRLVLRLINRKQLNPSDFTNPYAQTDKISAPQGGEVQEAVYLGPEGRGIFLRELSGLWRQRYLHEEKQQSLTTIMERQAQAAAAFFEGQLETFKPIEMS